MLAVYCVPRLENGSNDLKLLVIQHQLNLHSDKK